jgi:hypothetical protein
MEEGRVSISVGDLTMEASGSVDVLRRTVAEFFARLAAMKRGGEASVIVGDRSVREILLDLRDSGFFDEPRDSVSAYRRLREMGKTDITRNAVSMALKSLVEEGSLSRRAAGKTYAYVSPSVLA